MLVRRILRAYSSSESQRAGGSAVFRSLSQSSKSLATIIASGKASTAGKSNTVVSPAIGGALHTFNWDDGTTWDSSGIYSLATAVQKPTSGLARASVQVSV